MSCRGGNHEMQIETMDMSVTSQFERVPLCFVSKHLPGINRDDFNVVKNPDGGMWMDRFAGVLRPLIGNGCVCMRCLQAVADAGDEVVEVTNTAGIRGANMDAKHKRDVFGKRRIAVEATQRPCSTSNLHRLSSVAIPQFCQSRIDAFVSILLKLEAMVPPGPPYLPRPTGNSRK